jgi:predicted glutamine amidotransferase
MCVIICGNPNNITEEHLKNSYAKNPHGFGLMYLKDKQIKSVKFLPRNFKEVKKCFNKHKTRTNQIALHFRFATQGLTNNFNSHPFIVLDKNLGDSYSCLLMHNSPLIPSPLLSEKYSDTFYFSKYILRPILKNKPELITNQSFLNCLEKIINAETDTRVLLLNTKNNSFIFLGRFEQFENLTVSNTYSLKNYNSFSDFSYSSNSDYNFKSYSNDIPKSFDKDLFEFNQDTNPIEKITESPETEINKKLNNQELEFFKNVFETSTFEEIYREIENLNASELALLISEIQKLNQQKNESEVA